ncbi:MAG: hypothetical protein IJ728_13390 [Selenomonadaceae bacterium]|nr:hypothetical protein [Selenomonadaceae bacterium]
MEIVISVVQNLCSAGLGAFAGAWCAYVMSSKAEEKRRRDEYVAFLLIMNSDLGSLFSLLTNIPVEYLKEENGQKLVEFETQFPELSLSKEQMYKVALLSPDKRMPLTLMKMQDFLAVHNRRIEKENKAVLSLQFIENIFQELRMEIVSVQV